MVTNGADKALPIIVRCSKAIPKVLTNRTAVKQYDGSACQVDNSGIIVRAVVVDVVVVVEVGVWRFGAFQCRCCCCVDGKRPSFRIESGASIG